MNCKPLFLATLLFVVLARPIQAQTPPATIRAVIADDKAYLPGPAEMIASARAEVAAVHPQGRYVLVSKQEASLPPNSIIGQRDTGGASLILYDARTGRTKTLWESKADGGMHSGRVMEAEWLPNTDCAVAVVTNKVTSGQQGETTETSQLLFVNVAKSLTVRAIYTSSDVMMLDVSPHKPLALLRIRPVDVDRKQPGTIRFLNEKGVLSAARTSEFYGGFYGGWNAAGSDYAVVEQIPSTVPNTSPTLRWYEINAETGSETTLPVRPTRPKRTPEAPLLLRLTSSKMTNIPPGKNEVPVVLQTLYMESTQAAPTAPYHKAFLAPHADKSFLLPDLSAVLYNSDNALYAVPLVPVKATAFTEIQNAAYKRYALAQAKQLLSCLEQMMYDTHSLPSRENFFSALSPYVKDVDTFLANPATGSPGFTYAYSGPLLCSAFEKGSKNIFGYLASPGGRVAIYIGREVEWEDNK